MILLDRAHVRRAAVLRDSRPALAPQLERDRAQASFLPGAVREQALDADQALVNCRRGRAPALRRVEVRANYPPERGQAPVRVLVERDRLPDEAEAPASFPQVKGPTPA